MTDKNKKITELKQLLRDGKHAQALPLLEELLATSPEEAPLHWHRATCLEALERPEEALVAVERAIELRPDYAPAWLKRAELGGSVREDYPNYETDLRRAIALDPKLARAHQALAAWLYGQDKPAEAHAALAQAIALDPGDADAYVLRSRWAESAAWTVEPGEEPVKQFNGMEFSRSKLEAAVADLGRALELKPEEWRYRVKRGRLLHQLQRFDEALADYDSALAAMPADESMREMVQEMRQRSEGQGAGEREESARLLESMVNDLTPEELSRTDSDFAISMMRSAARSVRHGNSLEDALSQFVTDHPDDLLAVDIAYKVYGVGNEPEPIYAPADARKFPRYQRRFADFAQRELARQGIVPVGDYDPEHFLELLGRPTLIRIFRSEDGAICGASFKLAPKWPGWLAFLILKLTGNWKRPAVIDLESAFDDGGFLVTNNSGNNNPFGYGGGIDTEALPADATVEELAARHRDRIADYLQAHPAAKLRLARNFDSIVAIQRDLRDAKNAFRKSIGYIQTDELRQLLGARYDQLAERVKEKLALLIQMETQA